MFTLGEFIIALIAGALLGALGVGLVMITRRGSPNPAPLQPLHHLFARRGEKVTCINGHVICTVARDIVRGECAKIENQFVDWRQEKPDPNTVIPPCEKCGEMWFMNTPVGGMKLHISGDWR